MVFDFGEMPKKNRRIQIAQRLQAMISEILVLANAAVLTHTTKVRVTKVQQGHHKYDGVYV